MIGYLCSRVTRRLRAGTRSYGEVRLNVVVLRINRHIYIERVQVLPQNRDLTGGFIAGQSGNPSGRQKAFRAYIKESTAEGSELIEVVLGVLRDQNASNRERMEVATWLADRGFGKPAPVRD